MNVRNGRGIVVGDDKRNQNGVEDAESELEHLELSQVDLQGVFEAEGREEVVTVHQSVNEGVDPGTEVGSTVTNAVVQEATPDDANGEVMIDVQEGELFVLLAENNEDGVEHVEELGEVVAQDPEFDVSGEEAVDVEEVGKLEEVWEHTDDHQGGDDDLAEVVDEHGDLETSDFGAVLHHLAHCEDEDGIGEVTTDDEFPGDEVIELGEEAETGRFGFIASRGLLGNCGNGFDEGEDEVVEELRHFLFFVLYF